MAQKQSRLEKLLRYLNDNDTEKWQKCNPKLCKSAASTYAMGLPGAAALNSVPPFRSGCSGGGASALPLEKNARSQQVRSGRRCVY